MSIVRRLALVLFYAALLPLSTLLIARCSGSPSPTHHALGWTLEHWIASYADGAIYAIVALIIIRVLEWASQCAQDVLDEGRRRVSVKARASMATRSSLPVRDGSEWLSKVSPREYRAYLRRKELHWERHALQTKDADNDDADNESCSSASVTSRHTIGQPSLPSTPGIAVSLREPFRCKICNRKTCIDKEHVIAASVRADADASPAPSIVSTVVQGTPVPLPKVSVPKETDGIFEYLSLYMTHQMTVLMAIAAPLFIGHGIVTNCDRFLSEWSRLAVLIVGYFVPSLQLPKPEKLSLGLDRVGLALFGFGPAGDYLMGQVVLAAAAGLMARHSSPAKQFARLHLNGVKSIFTLGCEYVLMPAMLGSLVAWSGPLPITWRLVVHGWLVMSIVNGIIGELTRVLRSGFLHAWQRVGEVSTVAVGSCLLEHWTWTLRRYLIYSLGTMIGLLSCPGRSANLPIPLHLLLATSLTGHSYRIIHFLFNPFGRHLFTLLLKQTCHLLSLTSMVFGGRHPAEECFPLGGHYIFVPSCSNKRYTWDRLRQMRQVPVEPVDIASMTGKQEGRFKTFMVVYEPSHAVLRMVILCVIMLTLMFAYNLALLHIPPLVVSALPIDNALIAWIMGYIVIYMACMAGHFVYKHTQMTRGRLLWALQMFSILVCNAVINPLAIGFIAHNVYQARTIVAVLAQKDPWGTITTPTLLTGWMTGLPLCLSLLLLLSQPILHGSLQLTGRLLALAILPPLMCYVLPCNAPWQSQLQRLSHSVALVVVCLLYLLKALI